MRFACVNSHVRCNTVHNSKQVAHRAQRTKFSVCKEACTNKSKMSADALSQSSRQFYERTRFKMAASIFLAAMGMMSLAYVSSYGGESNSATHMMDVYDNAADDSIYQSQLALSGGYGSSNSAFPFHTTQVIFSHIGCGQDSPPSCSSLPSQCF
jgi:hypothetical protein